MFFEEEAMEIFMQFHEDGSAYVVHAETLEAARKGEADGGGDPDGVVAHVAFEEPGDAHGLELLLAAHYIQVPNGSTLEALAGAIFRAGVEYGRKDKFRWRPE